MPLFKDITRNLLELKKLATTANDVKALIRNFSPASAKVGEKQLKIDSQIDAEILKTISPQSPNQFDRDGLVRNKSSENIKKLSLDNILKYNNPSAGVQQLGIAEGTEADVLAIISKHQPEGLLKFYVELLSWDNERMGEKVEQKVEFLSTIDSLNEGLSPSWDSEEYFGRTEEVFRISTTARTLSINFTLIANNKQEHSKLIEDINFLTQCCYAGSIKESLGRQPPFIRLTVGDLYKRQLCLITNLDKDFNEVPWINIDKELPFLVKITMSCNILNSFERIRGEIESSVPNYNTVFFNYARTGTQ